MELSCFLAVSVLATGSPRTQLRGLGFRGVMVWGGPKSLDDKGYCLILLVNAANEW